jgi:hypothetical protein
VVKRQCPAFFFLLLTSSLLFAQDSPSNNSQPGNLSGAWQISWQGRNGTQQGTMQIQQEGSKLSGTFEDASGSSSVSGSIAGNKLSFSVQVQGGPIILAFTGTVDNDKMTGTFRPQGGGGGGRGRRGGSSGTYPWTGVRQPGN